MSTYNVEMSYFNGSGYDQLYPRSKMSNISDWNSYVYSKSQVDNTVNGINNKLNSGISGINPWVSFYNRTINRSGRINYAGGNSVVYSNFLSPNEDCYIICSITGTISHDNGNFYNNGRGFSASFTLSGIPIWRATLIGNSSTGEFQPVNINVQNKFIGTIMGSPQMEENEVDYIVPYESDEDYYARLSSIYGIARINQIVLSFELNTDRSLSGLYYSYDLSVHLQIYKRPGLLAH